MITILQHIFLLFTISVMGLYIDFMLIRTPRHYAGFSSTVFLSMYVGTICQRGGLL